MTFINILDAWPVERLQRLFAGITAESVTAALAREQRDLFDLAALLSPVARPFMESMAQQAHALTRRYFGRTISLYAPLYLSNVCGARCVYCGFSSDNKTHETRTTLSRHEIERECEVLSHLGYESVLLLTGDAPSAAPPAYIAEACAIARNYFSTVAVEVYAMDTDEYGLLCRHGMDSITLYMETYDRAAYGAMHLAGRKKDFLYRLGAIERAADAGARRISIGALLGLFQWHYEALYLGLHARYLQTRCWQSALAISFPRLRNTPAHFKTPHPVSDADLVQMMLALRLFLPEAGFNLSTRERPELRDHLLPLGITSMSAGSSTRPGGYAQPSCKNLAQFQIEDQRPPEQVAAMIKNAGYDPVWKDFDQAFLESGV